KKWANQPTLKTMLAIIARIATHKNRNLYYTNVSNRLSKPLFKNPLIYSLSHQHKQMHQYPYTNG
ncbi:MAG TPA: hypothetical protein PK667_12420, partial [Nitrosomonas europaea]|uniref:hypothetical protein n=1 Tax=Nitrosomonas europaea TaxID=915 RepID=UPI0024920F64